jgi:hypothetical protein
MQEKEKNVLQKINALSKSLGFDLENQTFVEIRTTEQEDIKELHLKNGSWESEAPWFAIDHDNDQKAYAFIPAEAFSQMVQTLKTVQKENFDLKLEKTIWQNVPIDFEDVWIVAMEEIKEKARAHDSSKPVSLDLDKLIRGIKKEHPNLFINLKEFTPHKIQLGNK